MIFLNRLHLIAFGLAALVSAGTAHAGGIEGGSDGGKAIAIQLHVEIPGAPSGEGLEVTVVPIDRDTQLPAVTDYIRSQLPSASTSDGSIQIVQPEGSADPALDAAALQIADGRPVKREFFPLRVARKIAKGYRDLYKKDPARAVFTIIRPSSNAGWAGFSAIVWKGVPAELALPAAISIFLVSGTMTYITPRLATYLSSAALTEKITGLKTGVKFEISKFLEGMLRWSPIGLFFATYPTLVSEATRNLHGLAPLHPDWGIGGYASRIYLGFGLFSIFSRAVWELGYNHEMARGLKDKIRSVNSVKWQAYAVQAVGSLMTAVAVTLPAFGFEKEAFTILQIQTGGGALILLSADNEQFRGLINRVYRSVAPQVERLIVQPVRRLASCVAQLVSSK